MSTEGREGQARRLGCGGPMVPKVRGIAEGGKGKVSSLRRNECH